MKVISFLVKVVLGIWIATMALLFLNFAYAIFRSGLEALR